MTRAQFCFAWVGGGGRGSRRQACAYKQADSPLQSQRRRTWLVSVVFVSCNQIPSATKDRTPQSHKEISSGPPRIRATSTPTRSRMRTGPGTHQAQAPRPNYQATRLVDRVLNDTREDCAKIAVANQAKQRAKKPKQISALASNKSTHDGVTVTSTQGEL